MNDHKEMKAIRIIIDKYIAGTYEGDIDKLRDVFDKKAVMNGYLGSNIVIGTPELFIKDIASSVSMKENCTQYNAEIESMRIDGNIATVCLTETGFRGDGTMVNQFHLIKREGKWRIISKLFTTIND